MSSKLLTFQYAKYLDLTGYIGCETYSLLSSSILALLCKNSFYHSEHNFQISLIVQFKIQYTVCYILQHVLRGLVNLQ